MKSKRYSSQEILSNINILMKHECDLLAEKKRINIELKKKRAAIKYWRGLDTTQYKMF